MEKRKLKPALIKPIWPIWTSSNCGFTRVNIACLFVWFDSLVFLGLHSTSANLNFFGQIKQFYMLSNWGMEPKTTMTTTSNHITNIVLPPLSQVKAYNTAGWTHTLVIITWVMLPEFFSFTWMFTSKFVTKFTSRTLDSLSVLWWKLTLSGWLLWMEMAQKGKKARRQKEGVYLLLFELHNNENSFVSTWDLLKACSQEK